MDDPNDKITPKSDLTTAKHLINSTLSTPNTKCLVADIKVFLFEHKNGPIRVYEI